MDHKSCFDPPPADYRDGANGNSRVAYPPTRDVTGVSNDKRCRSILDDDPGHNNPVSRRIIVSLCRDGAYKGCVRMD